MAVVWKVFFFFMCSKWGLDHLRLWSLVLGPLNSFCARRWLCSWPRTKTNTTKETVDFQRSSDHLSSMQAIKFLHQTDKDPSGSLKTRWYQEKWQWTCEWFVLFRSFNVLSKWSAWFCPREFYRPENLGGLCDSVCVHVQISPSNHASKIFCFRVDFWLETMCVHIACWESVKVAAKDTVTIFPEEKSTDAREMEKVLAKALHLKIKTSRHKKIISLTVDWIPVLKRDQTWQLWHHVVDSP